MKGIIRKGSKAEERLFSVIEDLQKKVLANKQKMPRLMLLLQNLKNPSQSLAREMCELFNSSQDLKLVIASAHFLAYMKLQKANYLFALNDNVFFGFEAPKNLEQAYQVMKHFNINAWVTGNKGISLTVKNGK